MELPSTCKGVSVKSKQRIEARTDRPALGVRSSLGTYINIQSPACKTQPEVCVVIFYSWFTETPEGPTTSTSTNKLVK